MITIGSADYDDNWIHLEILKRCVALKTSQRLSREEVGFRFLTHFFAVPERDAVLSWIGALFITGDVTGEPVDDWALLASRFAETLREVNLSRGPADPGDWIARQFKASFPDKRPFDLAWHELDEFIVDATKEARNGSGTGGSQA